MKDQFLEQELHWKIVGCFNGVHFRVYIATRLDIMYI